jgi:hypothetical protein
MSRIAAVPLGEAAWLPRAAEGEAAAAPAPAARGDREPTFESALDRLGGEIDRGEALVRRALHGGASLDAAQLIALQAGIYRYSEAVDLASKLIDRATSAVRTTLQSPGS